MFILPQKIEYVLDTLHRSGFEGYIVGGCVRDMLLGKIPHDFDITTNAAPEQIIGMFEKTVPTGISHGTVTVICEETPIEVTTYRTESGYSDCRHPDKVEFVSKLEADLARRDFTVNAIAYSHETGIVDLFDGQKDLENKVLRAVGNPEIRFTEDALRILRLFRFASVLGFNPENKTFEAALKKAELLENISKERIFTELKKCLCGKAPSALEPLIKAGGLKAIGIEKCKELEVITNFESKEKLRLFAFLSLCSCDFKNTLTALRASNEEKKYCSGLQNAFLQSSIKDVLNITSEEICRDYLSIKQELYKTDTKAELKELERIIKYSEPYKISHLKISGDELTQMGITGKAVGETLEKLRAAVCKNPELNTKEKLKSLVTK